MTHIHHPARSSSETTLYTAVAVTFAFAIVEALSGWWANSLALLGDAGHMLSDAMALAIAALAAWVARHPPSQRHSYGLARAEIIAALINGVTMVIIVAGIVTAAFHRLQTPPQINGLGVIVVAFLGLIINLVLYWMLSRGEQTLNIRGALLHIMGDLLGSLAALISGIVIWFSGWTLIDPLLSLFISVLILGSAAKLLWDSVSVIMEAVPPHLDLTEVGQTMAATPGVRSVHDLHIWSLSSAQVALSAHVVVKNMDEWPKILTDLRHTLHERFHIGHVTVQPETDPQVIHITPEEIHQMDR